MTDAKEKIEKTNLEKPAQETINIPKEAQENKEILPLPEAGEAQELRQQIESMDLSDGLKQHAVASAQSLASAPPEEKIRKLLLLAEEKGVVYAVNVAKKMDNAFILDALHDALAQKGLYKKFKQ